MDYQIRVKASVSVQKQGDDVVFTDQWFGPFSLLSDAEQCVLNLAARPNVVNAVVVNKQFVSSQQGIRCLGEDCDGILQEDGLGHLQCSRCGHRHTIERLAGFGGCDE